MGRKLNNHVIYNNIYVCSEIFREDLPMTPDTLPATLKRRLHGSKVESKEEVTVEFALPALALERVAEAGTTYAGNVSVLNPKAVASLRQLASRGRREMVDSMVQSYRREAPSRAAAMKRALQAGDAEGMSQAARTLMWTSTNIGATELAGCCTRLEQAIRQPESDPQIERWLVLRIESLLGAVLSALQPELLDQVA